MGKEGTIKLVNTGREKLSARIVLNCWERTVICWSRRSPGRRPQGSLIHPLRARTVRPRPEGKKPVYAYSGSAFRHAVRTKRPSPGANQRPGAGCQ
jgi:hypothetical protein